MIEGMMYERNLNKTQKAHYLKKGGSTEKG